MKKIYKTPKCRILQLRSELMLVQNSGGMIDVKEPDDSGAPGNQNESWAKPTGNLWLFE